jgi:hypothetical protein
MPLFKRFNDEKAGDGRDLPLNTGECRSAKAGGPKGTRKASEKN